MKLKASLLLILLVLTGAVSNSLADEAGPTIYLNWFKSANAQLRTAATYLRTGNMDFAALALEEIISFKTPGELKPGKETIVSMTTVEVKAALKLIDENQPTKARSGLLKLREALFQQHKKQDIEVFDDCIWGLVKRGPALWYFRKNKPDLNDRQQSQKVAEAAKNYLDQLNKCDAGAPSELKVDKDYRRLITGARESLERLPLEAVAKKDGGLLFRFIIELRSFDRLLYFRYG